MFHSDVGGIRVEPLVSCVCQKATLFSALNLNATT